MLPRHCVLCGRPSGNRNICAPCSRELPRNRHCCGLCGLPLHAVDDAICGACLKRAPPWDDSIAALLYEYPVDHLVRRFKFNSSLACGQVLAQELLTAIGRKQRSTPQVLVPVPLHCSRLFLRAYNQADVLARYVGKALNIPVRGNGLIRTRRTRAHSGLDASERKRNIRGAFESKNIAARHVAIVDDVMTTGATISECSRALRRAGVTTVSAWVGARAALR